MTERTQAEVDAIRAQWLAEDRWCSKFCGDSRHLSACPLAIDGATP